MNGRAPFGVLLRPPFDLQSHNTITTHKAKQTHNMGRRSGNAKAIQTHSNATSKKTKSNQSKHQTKAEVMVAVAC